MIGPETRVRLRKRADLQEQLIVELSRRTGDELATALDAELSRIFPARADAERVREAF